MLLTSALLLARMSPVSRRTTPRRSGGRLSPWFSQALPLRQGRPRSSAGAILHAEWHPPPEWHSPRPRPFSTLRARRPIDRGAPIPILSVQVRLRHTPSGSCCAELEDRAPEVASPDGALTRAWGARDARCVEDAGGPRAEEGGCTRSRVRARRSVRRQRSSEGEGAPRLRESALREWLSARCSSRRSDILPPRSLAAAAAAAAAAWGNWSAGRLLQLCGPSLLAVALSAALQANAAVRNAHPPPS